MAELQYIGPLVMGVIIGLYELILIHRDENFRGSHWLSHGIHSVSWAMLAVFATMNAEYVYANLTFLQSVPYLNNIIVFRIFIGLLTMIKVHSASAVVKTTIGSSKGLKETWAHSFIVSALVVVAPYIWPFVEPVVNPYLGGRK
ncbi:MAG: hypothetical protein QT11_C0001G0338 [archaeon GW2011_AR20]|nr:MAG: hypothetical protein QT11_C0001G0338 [archaeon GW2011_AR20]AQS28015.1 hypothetical protein [uncultured archaeon]AQS28506.1 hypothetical protein [uncultured archaeon]AQS28616.1 hypothetical protein [uncultured archaeon]MBS3160346.1 hypothetical protein [Candidatus Woesearchaeota archaeon]